MIAQPLNDEECLGKLTTAAVQGLQRPELRELASRFQTAKELAAWIRGLPQRDDGGDPTDGPRVTCDVTQRARLIADDPNCVERAMLYVAAAELLDAGPVRQLATIETGRGRHTFPVENGEPVVLDPAVSRNGLRAGVWHIRNAGQTPPPETTVAEMEPRRLLAWVVDLAEEVAEDRDGAPGRARVERARQIYPALLEGRAISPRDRADALYTLRMAGEAAPLFGDTGVLGVRIARSGVARLAARQVRRNAKVDPRRVAYWGGKAVATYYGAGALYDPIYDEVTKRKKRPAASSDSPPQRPASAGQKPSGVPGSLDALRKKGKQDG